uniref:Helicase ATP-binding domain-containing protein n=1 Tax=Oryza rufipogon TaxID=4529 RepID=A0A0E0R8X5_ORYRU
MGTERKRKVSREPLRRGRQDLRLRQARRRRHHQRHRRRRGGQPAPNRRGTSSPKTLEKRRTLPVWQQKDDFLAVLHDNQALILVGETGSGKHSDGIAPQYLDPQIHRSAAIGSGEWHSGFQYGVDKVFQPLPSSPSMGHELLCWGSVLSGESVFRPLPSLPSTGQSAFPSATALHLIQALRDMAAINFLEHLKMAIAGIIGQHKYTHITLKPSYAMYYVDLVMKQATLCSFLNFIHNKTRGILHTLSS